MSKGKDKILLGLLVVLGLWLGGCGAEEAASGPEAEGVSNNVANNTTGDVNNEQDTPDGVNNQSDANNQNNDAGGNGVNNGAGNNGGNNGVNNDAGNNGGNNDDIAVPTCDADADCLDACPQDAARGCSCVVSPQGVGVCAALCRDDLDCPRGNDETGGFACNATTGVCRPAEQASGCLQDSDCQSCDASQGFGCLCVTTNGANTCVAACEEDQDCPPNRLGESVSCNEGRCALGSGQAPSCEVDEDCPEQGTDGESLICNDRGRCVPEDSSQPMSCEVDADCPAQGEQGNALVCGDQGTCVPERGGRSCQSDADCPETPAGEPGDCQEGVCVAPSGGPGGCTQDADCPEGPEGQALTCQEGRCQVASQQEGCTQDADCPEGPEGQPGVCGEDGSCGAAGGPSSCEVDEDCPAQDDQGNALVCGDAGACVPADDGGGDGDTCEVGEACQGCQGELGCVCRTTPRGAACVPACESDEDCPGEGPNGSALVCRPAGFCGPDRM